MNGRPPREEEGKKVDEKNKSLFFLRKKKGTAGTREGKRKALLIEKNAASSFLCRERKRN